MNDSSRPAFADRLRLAMIERRHVARRGAKSGVDVSALARAIGVTTEMARRYANGDAMPGADKLQAIAEWLSVRTAWLRDGEGARDVPVGSRVALEVRHPEQGAYTLRSTGARKEYIEWLLLLDALSEADRAAVVTLARAGRQAALEPSTL